MHSAQCSDPVHYRWPAIELLLHCCALSPSRSPANNYLGFSISNPSVFLSVSSHSICSEIRVKKGGVIWGFLGRFVNQPPHPPIFGKVFPKKRFYFWGAPLYGACQKNVDLGLGMRICRRIPKQSGLKTYYNATKTVIWKFNQKFRIFRQAPFNRQWQRNTSLENNFQVNFDKANSKAIWFAVRIVPWIHCTSETQYFTPSIACSLKK